MDGRATLTFTSPADIETCAAGSFILWHYLRHVCLRQWGGFTSGSASTRGYEVIFSSLLFLPLSLSIHTVFPHWSRGTRPRDVCGTRIPLIFGCLLLCTSIREIVGRIPDEASAEGGKHRMMGEKLYTQGIGFSYTGWCDPV